MKSYVTKQNIRTCILLFFVLISVFFTSPKFFSQWMYRPDNHVFVGMTTYFEDFYYYLDQFYQGAHGNWLTENRFSIDRFPATFIYFPHILLGKIGGFFGFESFQSYNYFGLLFKFLFILFAYFVVQLYIPKNFTSQMIVMGIFIFSSALPNISLHDGSFHFDRAVDVFRSANRVLARFGTSPSGMLANSLAILVFLQLYRFLFTELVSKRTHTLSDIVNVQIPWKHFLLIALFYFLIVCADPFIALVLIASFGVTLIAKKVSIKSVPIFSSLFCVLLFILSGVGIILSVYVHADPVYRQANFWDIQQYLRQIKSGGILHYIEGFGLQMPLGVFGIYLLIRKKQKSLIEQFGISILCISLLGYGIPLLFQLPVTGFRFLFPAVYVFLSVCTYMSIRYFATYIHHPKAETLLLCVYFCINLLTFLRGWTAEIQPLSEPAYHFAYIPNALYEGFLFLRTAEPLQGNVLASSSTSIDIMIPGLTGRYTYSGHPLTTYRAKTRDNNSSKFFFKWTDGAETRDFLKSHNIRFIFVTAYAYVAQDMKTYYPFLHVAFENPLVTIFRYDPE